MDSGGVGATEWGVARRGGSSECREAMIVEVNRRVRKRRLFRSQRAELVGAIADTRAMFEGKGWA